MTNSISRRQPNGLVVMPAATLPNWSTMLTNADPGEHGVFDFTTRNGYRVAFEGGLARKIPTMFKRLDAMGKRTACVMRLPSLATM